MFLQKPPCGFFIFLSKCAEMLHAVRLIVRKRLADQRRQALGGHILKGDAVLLPDVAHEARDLRVIGHGGELCADA